MNLFLWRLHLSRRSVWPLSQAQKEALAAFRSRLRKRRYSFESAPCVCGANDGIRIGRRDRYGLPLQTVLCPHCAVMRTTPRMTSESLGRFYAEEYRLLYGGDEAAPDSFLETQVTSGRRIMDFVVPPIGEDVRRVVFDVGCGAGGVLMPFREAGWMVDGCDLGRRYLKRGRDEGMDLLEGDMSVLKDFCPAGLILLVHVLEHLPDPIASLREAASLLSEPGYIYVELPGIYNIKGMYGDVLRFLQNAHLYHFTLHTLTVLMSHAGFELVQGNESITALYRRNPGMTPLAWPGQEHRDILRYVTSVERGYVVHALDAATMRRAPLRLIRKAGALALRTLCGEARLGRIKNTLGIGS